MVNLVDDEWMMMKLKWISQWGLSQNVKSSLQLAEVGHPPLVMSRVLSISISQKPNEKRKGGPIDLEASKKILRDRVVSAFVG